eukprot:3593280-Amphidinium_carterae.1
MPPHVCALLGLDLERELRWQVHIHARDGSDRLHRLDFNLREYIWVYNSTWSLRYSEATNSAQLSKSDDSLMTCDLSHTYWERAVLQKACPGMGAHSRRRLADPTEGNHAQMGSAGAQCCRCDVEEEEEIDLPSGQNVKHVTAAALEKVVQQRQMAVVAARHPHLST